VGEPQHNVPEGVCGVVGILSGPDGYVWAEASDFNQSGYGGFKLAEAQELRVRNALRMEFIRRSCGDPIVAAIDQYITDQICRRLKGFKETLVRIGHADE
jgi:hypothetical protein